jgi:CarD family transcriptional regulator
MQVEIGDTLVYPHHGAATVIALRDRVVRGSDVKYVKLRVHSNDLTIELPADSITDVGVRDVINSEGVDEVYAVLRTDLPEDTGNWSRRYKANQEKLASGNVLKAAEVVRDLWRRDVSRGLSTGEKAMLQKARHTVESELALSLDRSETDAATAVETVLQEHTIH